MQTVTFSLTITESLNDWLKVKANNLGVGKNAQIIFLLEQARLDSQEGKKDVKDDRTEVDFL